MQSAVTVRMSETLMMQCGIAATADGRSVAAWVRKLAASAVDMDEPEPEPKPKPTRPRRRAAPNPHPEIGVLVHIADYLADLCQWLAAHESQEGGQIQPILDPGKCQDLGLDLRVALECVIDRIESLKSQ